MVFYPTDVSLPAILMPTKLGHVYSPRAHCYFHPTGYNTCYDHVTVVCVCAVDNRYVRTQSDPGTGSVQTAHPQKQGCILCSYTYAIFLLLILAQRPIEKLSLKFLPQKFYCLQYTWVTN